MTSSSRRQLFVSNKAKTGAKFWIANLTGKRFSTRWGSLTSTGYTRRSLPETFNTVEEARKHYNRRVAEKRRKGYRSLNTVAGKLFSSKQTLSAAEIKKYHNRYQRAVSANLPKNLLVKP